ncbi:putative serine protease K12H4.7 isoform X2 [Hyposmocoma kahamanoa]|uniref:putative serine protease K12H4.7 isoform X2 n=1 Tax=Hyposmocoma kahamanoa TaxID=1477025 RepID=UPI000E6D8F7B|nr:putative serine protease K12H4.7 isoform X2 [Hyposmocoma kahamanoa]
MENGNLGAPGAFEDNETPAPKWFSQKLDHSNPSDLRTWNQRYYMNDSFYDYEDPGPIFLMIGGEGPADPRWMVKGTWIEYAKLFKALCFNLEHRYYGESRPTTDLSVKNLQFLSSQQALADLANFINAMNQKLKLRKNVKWMVFGGSYPGSLAAWLRMKYPHLVYGAVSSSAPLLAKVDFMEYFQVVVKALREKTGGDDCVNHLKEGMQQVDMMLKANPEVIEKEFKVCSPFQGVSANDLKNFFNSIADDFADLVQYNEDNRFSVDEKYKNVTINTVCKILTDSEGNKAAYKKLAEFNAITLEKSHETCMDYNYGKMINELRAVEWKENTGGARQWMYQTCTEFGFYQTSSGAADIFGNHFDLDFFVQQCMDIFGQKYNLDFIRNAVAWTNTKYGALDIEVTRVVYVQGSVDPWHALGILKTQDNGAPAIYINGTAHCANMYSPSDNDSTELTEARVEIQQFLDSWLREP